MAIPSTCSRRLYEPNGQRFHQNLTTCLLAPPFRFADFDKGCGQELLNVGRYTAQGSTNFFDSLFGKGFGELFALGKVVVVSLCDSTYRPNQIFAARGERLPQRGVDQCE